MGSTKKHKKEKEVSLKRHKHKDKQRTPSPPIVDRGSGGGGGGGGVGSSRNDRYRDRGGGGGGGGGERDREREGRDRERRHHKNKHKERKHRERSRERQRDADYHSDSSDVIEVPIAPPAPIITPHLIAAARKSRSPDTASTSIPENGAGDCLSIAETNKLRAKLGLKPLEMDSGPSTSAGSSEQKRSVDGQPLLKDDWGEFVHKPAKNLAEQKQADKIREKIRQKKEKRLLEDKLKSVRGLGDLDETDDITNWVQRSREKEKQKADAQHRAKMLEEMDEEFGVTDLVRQEHKTVKQKMYKESNLKGLKVQHGTDAFAEGKTVILTLKDSEVLNDDDEDTLVNVNMIDDERYIKNVENKKQNPQHYGYNVYEEQFDELGQPIERSILGKYDEEIDGDKRQEFKIGENSADEILRKRKLLMIKTKLAGKRLETLDEPLIHLASDTYTEDEIAKFKKPKKKIKKIRQKLKAIDLQPLNDGASRNDYKRGSGRHGRDAIDTDDFPAFDSDMKNIKYEEEDDDLEQILSKARRLKQKESLINKTFDAATVDHKIKDEDQIKQELEMDDDVEARDNIILNSTAEFCRTLGDIPTYGMSGNRDELAGDLMDFDMDIDEPDDDLINDQDDSGAGVWNSVNPDVEIVSPTEKPIEITEVAILDEEPDVGSGMGAALKLALSKGYLEKEESKRPSSTRMAYLQAKNYSIEDKAYTEDDKFQRRDRYHNGPISEFHEKDSYKPNVKLEYIDDNGRLLNEKEAFRYLSHKFHGKGPGKNKIEKRLKKSEQDGLMRKMSSTDTPLGTLTMLQHKQKETHSPYIVLSGSKQTHAQATITKHNK